MKNAFTNIVAKLTIVSMLFAMVGLMAPAPASAAGVNVYADLDPDTNYNGVGGLLDSSSTDFNASVSAPPDLAANATAEVYISWIADSQYATDDIVEFIGAAGLTFANTCSSPTVDADATDPDDGSAVASGTSYVYTFTAPTTAAMTTGVEFCLVVTAPATMDTYMIQMGSTNDTADHGVVLVYVEGDNDVVVTGIVPETLDQTLTAHTCDLGIITSAAVSTCGYSIVVDTSASAGVRTYITEDGDLSNLTPPLADNDADSIDDITDVLDGTVTAGAEEYGVQITGSAGVTVLPGACVGGDFAANDCAIQSDTLDDMFYTSVAGIATVDVTHSASVNSDTQPSSHSHTVSYYTTTNY